MCVGCGVPSGLKPQLCSLLQGDFQEFPNLLDSTSASLKGNKSCFLGLLKHETNSSPAHRSPGGSWRKLRRRLEPCVPALGGEGGCHVLPLDPLPRAARPGWPTRRSPHTPPPAPHPLPPPAPRPVCPVLPDTPQGRTHPQRISLRALARDWWSRFWFPTARGSPIPAPSHPLFPSAWTEQRPACAHSVTPAPPTTPRTELRLNIVNKRQPAQPKIRG